MVLQLTYPRNGFLLELGADSPDEDKLLNMVKRAEGVFIKQTFLLTKQISSVKDIKQIIGNKMLILDLRLEHPSAEDYQSLKVVLRNIEVDAITIMGIYGKEPIMTAFEKIGKNVAAIIDIGTEYYRSQFPDKAIISFSKTARDCSCRSVIMTSFFPERIRQVRSSLGGNFEIIAANGEGLPAGEGIRAGANLEILPSSIWTNVNTSHSSIR